MRRITHTAKSWVQRRVGGISCRALCTGLSIFTGVILVVMAVWFLTPLPTSVARHVWERYHAAELALALDRSDADLAFTLGTYFFGNQSLIGTTGERPYDLPLAERAFRKALVINPSFPLAHYMLARIEFVHADFNTALKDLNAELVLNPAFMRTFYMRGLTYAYRDFPGDLPLAEADFRIIIRWAPEAWAGYNDLAFVLAKEGKYEDAADVLKTGIASADGGAANPWLWNTLGTMRLNLGEPSLALASFLKAQVLAESLSAVDWQRAYPGNDPGLAAGGLVAMRNGIARNIAAAREALDK